MPSNAPTVAPAKTARADRDNAREATRPVSTLRQLPARRVEPPYDDELEPETFCDAAINAVQGALALSFALPSGLPAVPDVPPLPRPDEPTRRLRLVPPLEQPDMAEPLARRGSGRRQPARQTRRDDFGPQRTPRAMLPDPAVWAARLVQALVEVTCGLRPISQLVRWTSTDVHDLVKRRVAHTQSRPHPARAGMTVRSVHVSEPGDGVAEVCAVIAHGPRCQAIALRLEGVDGRWQCVALQGDGFHRLSAGSPCGQTTDRQ